jgi:hypothetical protein
LYRDVDLLEAARVALESSEFAKARELLRQHRLEYRETDDDMREGYDIIADCLEKPGPTTTLRARRFYDEQTHSTLRRRVRRACLESGHRSW